MQLVKGFEIRSFSGTEQRDSDWSAAAQRIDLICLSLHSEEGKKQGIQIPGPLD